jgi:hypothetical protein
MLTFKFSRCIVGRAHDGCSDGSRDMWKQLFQG